MPKKLPVLILLGIFFGLVSIVFGTANFFKKQSSPAKNININQSQSKKTPSYLTQIPNKDSITVTPTTKADNSPTSNTVYAYQNENDNFKTYFPDKFINTDSNVKFEKKDSSITFTPINTRHQSAGKNDQNQIVYSKIFQNGDKFIDLKYTIEANRLVEEYIVNQKQAIPKLEQKVDLFNAYPVIKSGQIDFYKPTTDNFLWSIPAPFMYEQNNPSTKNSGIKFNLQCQNPDTPLKDCRSFVFIKEITPEGQKWLDDPNRNYPVVIDPFIDGGPCWGIGGYCDSGCNQNGVSPWSVYTTCTQQSACANTNCWGYSGACEPTRCIYGQLNTYSTNWTNSSCTTTGGTCYVSYAGDGCGTSGDCYYNRGSLVTRYRTASCTSFTCYTLRGDCVWYAPVYWYAATGAVTKYLGSGTACADNSGSCFKLTGGATSYTGSGTGCPTGSSACAGALTRYDRTQCSWYPGSTGTGLIIEKLLIESIKLN